MNRDMEVRTAFRIVGREIYRFLVSMSFGPILFLALAGGGLYIVRLIDSTGRFSVIVLATIGFCYALVMVVKLLVDVTRVSWHIYQNWQ